MLLPFAVAFSLVLWVLLWGLDVKALDAFMIALLVMILAATAHIVMPYLPGRKSRTEQDPDPAPFT